MGGALCGNALGFQSELIRYWELRGLPWAISRSGPEVWLLPRSHANLGREKRVSARNLEFELPPRDPWPWIVMNSDFFLSRNNFNSHLYLKKKCVLHFELISKSDIIIGSSSFKNGYL